MPTSGFFVKDIIVLGDEQGLNGEHRESMLPIADFKRIVCNQGIVDLTRVNRIVKQILSIATYTKAHASPEYLTRAITDEFSFYTKSTPLSIEEYCSIINKIAVELRFFPPNIVIIASSMPVLWPDGSVRNAVLHIQTPNHADAMVKIHHFSKKHHHHRDPLYAHYHHVPYPQKMDDYKSAQYSPHIVLANTALCINDVNQHHSAILVEGANLPPIIHAIDICLDHDNGVAMENTTQLLKSHLFPPLYISHIISSQTIYANPGRSVAAVTQADIRQRNVPGVPREKKELIYTLFGQHSVAFVYEPRRVELLHSKLFDIATKNLRPQDIVHLKDPHHNTLLHQILLKDKKSSPTCVHFGKRLDKLIPRFRGPDINQQNLDGDTPLHLAIKWVTDENILIRFLEQGARLDIKNSAGLTPISLAYQHPDPAVLTSLITKLINSGPVYLTHRHTILDVVTELKAPLQKKVLIAAVQFELSHAQPNMPILVTLLERLAPLSVLDLSLTPFATRHGETALERLLMTDPHFASLECNEKEIIMAYFMQSPACLLRFKGDLDIADTLISKLFTLFRSASAGHFMAWIKENILQSAEQAKNLSRLEQDIKDPFTLLNIVLNIHYFDTLCERPHGLNFAEYILVKLYILKQTDVPIPPGIMKKLLDKIGPALHIPSPQYHLENILRAGIISQDGHALQSWFYNTLLNYELSTNSPQIDFILSLPESIIDWHKPADMPEELTVAETFVALVLLSPIPRSESTPLLNRVLPKEPERVFNMLSNIIIVIGNDSDSDSDDEVPITLTQLYQRVLLHESQPDRAMNIPLVIALLRKNLELSIPAEHTLTLAEQLFSNIYLLATFNHLPEEIRFLLLDLIVPQLQDPLERSINKVTAHLSTLDCEHPPEEQPQHNLYDFLLDYVLGHSSPSLFHFDIITTSIKQLIDLKIPCSLSNTLSLAEQAIATIYRIECHQTIDSTDKYQTLKILFQALDTPIEEAIERIALSFLLLPNRATKKPPCDVQSWIYRALFTIELENYTPTDQKQPLRFLPIVMQQQAALHVTPPTENAAEKALMHAASLEDELLFRQAYQELEKVDDKIDLSRICRQFSPHTQAERAEWMRQTHFRMSVQQRIFLELKKSEQASIRKLFNSVTLINLKEDCGLNNSLTMAEQFIAQAAIFSLRPSIVRSPDDIAVTEHLIGSVVEELAPPIQKTIQRIIASFLVAPNHVLTTQPAVITYYIYSTLIKQVLLKHPISLNLLRNILSPTSPEYCLHHMPGIDPSLTMAEQVVKTAVLCRNEELLEVVMRHYQTAQKDIDITKILATCSHAPHAGHWFVKFINEIQSKWLILEEFKKEKEANIDLMLDLIHEHEIDVNESSELNNGLTILEQSFAQAYLSNSPKLFFSILECISWEPIETIVTKVARSLVAPDLDLVQNEAIHNRFKTFCYTTLLSLELDSSPPNTQSICHLLSKHGLSFQWENPDSCLLFLTKILSACGKAQSTEILTLFYTNILPRTLPRYLTDAIQRIPLATDQKWVMENLITLANHKNPVDASTVALLSTSIPLSSPPTFFKPDPRAQLDPPTTQPTKIP